MTEITSTTTDTDTDITPTMPANLPWLVFSNPGELDLRSVTTFGISAKPGTETPIGYFGTGLKYALAICARLGAEVRLHVGEQELLLRGTEDTFRGKVFTRLYLDDLATQGTLLLPFTTELGKTWEPWMAYRELWANAKDEGGVVMHMAEISALHIDQTRIYVRSQELYDVYLTHGEHFVTSEPICVLPGVNLHPPGPSLLCYHGVRMAPTVDRETSAQFTYDLTGQHELTEDRKLADLYQAKKMVAEGLLQCTDRGVLEEVLGAEGGLEAKLDFDWYGTDPSEEFISVALEAVRTKRCKNASVKDLLRRIANAQLEAALVAPIGESWKEILAGAPAEPEAREGTGAVSYIWGLGVDVKELRAAVGYWRRVAAAKWVGTVPEGSEASATDEDMELPF